mmetsp:Transcript_26768/g.56273  ORF Transcript_26768/g.56273 Transcript_26768/m.56273 type:complete len:86 (+) Transcript_26768:2373-2630(+)
MNHCRATFPSSLLSQQPMTTSPSCLPPWPMPTPSLKLHPNLPPNAMQFILRIETPPLGDNTARSYRVRPQEVDASGRRRRRSSRQ